MITVLPHSFSLPKIRKNFQTSNFQTSKEHLWPYYDEARIMEVLHYLLENAIDYTRDTIWVNGKKRGKEVWISVKDNGSGIPEEKIEQIFQLFSWVNESRSLEERRFGRMGLGLYICQQILEPHKKDMWVSSTSEEGTTFTFSLPRKSKKEED